VSRISVLVASPLRMTAIKARTFVLVQQNLGMNRPGGAKIALTTIFPGVTLLGAIGRPNSAPAPVTVAFSGSY
jgi:hypothetical protein